MPGKLGWTCSRCTFEHHAPGTRCVMCNELRTTKQHMIDFVQGKPIPESLKVNTATVTVVDPLNKKDTETIKSNTTSTAKRKEPPWDNAPENYPQKKRQATSHYFTCPKEPASCGNAGATSASVLNPYASAVSRIPTANSSLVARADNALETQPQNTEEASLSDANANIHNRHRNQLNSNYISTSNKQNPNNAIHNKSLPFNHQRQLPQNQLKNHNENWNPQRQGNQQKPPAFQKTKNNNKRPPQSNGIPFNNVGNSLPVHFKPQIIAHYVPGPVPLDESTLSEWVYPKDPKFSRREYQVEISRSALFQNTLVSLPTGLGKTLIAAVVMYNYYRWFPTGKLIFCAPTNPLVSQQAVAVCQLIGIPAKDAAVMTGRISHNERKQIWKERRVFFCTPQTVQKDFEQSEDIPASQVVCLILDEAHKTTGDYAYVNVVELLEKAKAKFRIVGLSATPGSTIEGIQKIVTNLRIAKIEFRQEEDPSIVEHTHSRESEVVVVEEPSVVTTVMDRMVQLLLTPYLRKVQENGLLTNVRDGTTVSKMNVLKAQELCRNNTDSHPKSVRSYLDVVMKVIHWRDCLGSHGIGLFCSKLGEFLRKPKWGSLSTLAKSEEFQEIWTMAQGASTNAEGNVDSKKLSEQNPKLLKLKEILDEHFERARVRDAQERAQGSQRPTTLSSTRAIVFSQLRDSVTEIVQHLEASRPLVRAHRFVGQSKGSSSGKKDDEGNDQNDGLKGMNQREQHKVIKEFREGIYNVLVCTCIGEEGLDIGEVDLIINFDTPMSPIRSLQRVGRTGRKRDGRVVVLLTKKEEKKYKAAKSSERTLARALRDSTKFNVVPSAPMFPTERPLPEMSEREGLNQIHFRLTQVTGLCSSGKKNRRRSSKHRLSPKNQDADLCGRWKLTDDEERRRNQFLSGSALLYLKFCDKSDFGVPASVRKRFLKARTMTLAAQTPVDLSRYPLGSTLKLLRSFHGLYGKRSDPSSIPFSTRVSSRENKTTQLVFPFLERVTSGTTTLRAFNETFKNNGNSCKESEESGLMNASRSHHSKTLCTDQTLNIPHHGGHVLDTTAGNYFNRCEQEPAAPVALPAPSNPYKKQRDKGNGSNSVIARRNKEPERSSRISDDKSSQNTAVPTLPVRSAVQGNASLKPTPLPNPYATSSRQKVAQRSRSDEQGGPANRSFSNNEAGSLPNMTVLGNLAEPAFAKPTNGSNEDCDGITVPFSPNKETKDELDKEGSFGNEKEMDYFRLPQPESSSSENDSDGIDNNEVARTDLGAPEGNRTVSTRTTPMQQSTHMAVKTGSMQKIQEVSYGHCADLPVKIVIENMPAGNGDDVGVADCPKEGNELKSNAEDSEPLKLPTQSSNSSDEQDSQSLRLPTQDSSSSSSDDENSKQNKEFDDEDCASAAQPTFEGPHSKLPCVETLHDDCSEKLPVKFTSIKKPGNILLPEYECKVQSNTEVEDSDDMPLIALRKNQTAFDSAKGGGQLLQERAIPRDNQSDTKKMNLCDLTSEDTEEVLLNTRNCKKPVDPFSSQGDSLRTQRVEAKTPKDTATKAKSPILLVDTPNENTAKKQETLGGLTDTPNEHENSCFVNDIESIVCAICFSGECRDDPIILCDGTGPQETNSCNIAVHQSCYQVNPEQLDKLESWRCEPCSIRYKVHVTKEIANYDFDLLSCYVCKSREGPLRRISQDVWCHPYCRQWSSASDNLPCSLCSLKGAVQCCAQQCSAAVHPHCALSSYSKGSQKSWTFLRVVFPPFREQTSDDSLSILFCPKDSKESHEFIRQHSDGIGNASKERARLNIIPPQGPSHLNEGSTKKSESGNAVGRRLRKMGNISAAATRKESRHVVHPRKRQGKQALAIAVGDEVRPSPLDAEERQARKRARLEQRMQAKHFFDEEAGIESEGDEGDEEEARDLADLEADELSSSSFINDSSQLGYTQDELGRVDPTQANSATPALPGDYEDGMHRRLDLERTLQNRYATPVLNRKMRRNSLTPADAPESERGLGKMHFVRSVLEHHKNGGDADQIEELYHKIQQQEPTPNEGESEPLSNTFASFRNPQFDDENENLVEFDYGF